MFPGGSLEWRTMLIPCTNYSIKINQIIYLDLDLTGIISEWINRYATEYVCAVNCVLKTFWFVYYINIALISHADIFKQ